MEKRVVAEKRKNCLTFSHVPTISLTVQDKFMLQGLKCMNGLKNDTALRNCKKTWFLRLRINIKRMEFIHQYTLALFLEIGKRQAHELIKAHFRF